MSNKNPFRPPHSSESKQEVVMTPPPQLPQRTATPSSSSSPSQQAMQVSSNHDISAIGEDVLDELPPPYTPSPNAAEETVGLGPRRPFQPPPQPPPDPHRHPNWSPPPAPPPPAPGPSWYPPPPPQHPGTGFAPWQTMQQYRQRQTGGGGLIGSLIDTVRDIADTVSGAHDGRSVIVQPANSSAYAAPYGSTVYSPPPGPPGQSQPPQSPQPPQPPQPPPPPLRPASTPPYATSGGIPDDGTPTQTPVPGHPLLRDGNLLVYPRDHLCVKCKNTGYKSYDPSHPCRKCWDKYGRPYAGALTYTPWASSRNDSRMQRPLPRFPPPHASSATPHHARSVSQPHHFAPGPGTSYYVVDPLSPYPPTPPVPNAITVAPGDPRLGGQLCWRCGGAGIKTVFLIDVTTCDTCNGTGRVWV